MMICQKESCTGCGACRYVCPKECITMEEDITGAIYPKVNIDQCISCNRCKKVCPSLKDIEKNAPIKCYAAFSTDTKERKMSASGGIGAEIYKNAVRENKYIVGAKSNDDFSVSLELGKSKDDIEAFKNSKYVFSDCNGVYKDIKSSLEEGKGVVVIGLPCQIAAIKSIFPHEENLFTADVICHGTTPFKYLKEHINDLEKKLREKAFKMSFRDPYKGTELFYFSLYNEENGLIYAHRTMDGDIYNFGYHRGITYRENCYSCKYACEKRVSDITLGDCKEKITHNGEVLDKKVSVVLANTKKGEEILLDLANDGRIVLEEYSLKNAIEKDSQLRHPTIKTKNRLRFEKQILKNKGFIKSINIVIRFNKAKDLKKEAAILVRKIKGKIAGWLRKG